MPRRRTPPHLERGATGLFHWRRRWPRRAGGPRTAPSGKVFLRFALRTDLRSDAEILARRLTALSDRIFAALTETAMPIAPELAETLLVDLVRFEIAAFERARAVAPTRSPEAAGLDRARERATEEMLRRALALRDREPARGPLRAAARRLDVPLDEADDDWRALAVEATKALIDVSRERGRRDGGEHEGPTRAFRAAMAFDEGAEPKAHVRSAGPRPTVEPGPTPRPMPFAADAAAQAAPAETSTDPFPLVARHDPTPPDPAVANRTSETTATPSADAAAASPSKDAITLDAMFRLYGEARCAGKAALEAEERADQAKWTSYRRNSFGNLEGTRKLVVALIGDHPLPELARGDFTEAFSSIQKVPANHGKSRSETRAIREIIAETDAEELEAMERLHLEMTARGESLGNIEAAQHGASIARLHASTVHRHTQGARRVLRHAVKLGLIEGNLMARIIWAKEGSRIRRRCRRTTGARSGRRCCPSSSGRPCSKGPSPTPGTRCSGRR